MRCACVIDRAQVRQVPAADIFFIMFAIVFFISRLVVYPRYLLWTALYVCSIDRATDRDLRPQPA